MVLAAQFESLVPPFTLTLSLPLSVMAALRFLWLSYFNASAGLFTASPGLFITCR
jgi:multidrug efflux pump subunit AcrB